MFSSLTIHDCGLERQNLVPICLDTAPSFPASPRALKKEEYSVPDSWAAKDITLAEGHLELALLERISEGRMGVTYSARVVSATRSHVDVSASLPQVLCLKFARMQHCRSLAREAWFYEQLTECQGISVARCFGFFTSTLNKQEVAVESILPWNKFQDESDETEEETEELTWSSPSKDWLPDDFPHTYEFHDVRGLKRDSTWNSWNPSDDNPTIAVLILEKLGERCVEHWEMWQKPKDGLKEDITAIVEDIGAHGVIHTDVTAFNILHFTGDAVTCPRHNVVHNWRIIDFDRSRKIDMAQACDFTKRALESDIKHIGKLGLFWGNLLHTC
ncbi:hypothetical protein MPER_11964 [Moniliophthora perniciosa FA553]|nr:hypothetical protein MPER_11964 [Moniliophthora perniciosa FA553]